MRRATGTRRGIVEQQSDNPGVSRGQNQLHVSPETSAAATGVAQPLLDRIDSALPATQLLVVTSDEEMAAALAGRLVASAPPGVRVLAATEHRRATRILRAAPAHVLLAPAATIVALMQSAVLKLDAVKVAVLAWIDEQGEAATAALETVMGEVPKDAARFVLASAVTPVVDQLVERYARRARRVQPAASELAPVSLSYVATAETARITALRRTLDALDPDSALVITRDPAAREVIHSALQSLGYGGDAAPVRVSDVNDDASHPAPPAVTVLYDLPASEPELRQLVAAASPARVVAIVTPRQISALRRMAGGSVAPLALPEAAVRARSREESLRDELRAVLQTEQCARELVMLEPLFADHDGAEVAAAALRLLERQRATPVTLGAPSAQGPVTRLYVNVGAMDDIRPGDLVGAITNEAGISRAELGRVDVRDKHSTVEVATPVANAVVSKLTGVQMKGRRVIARVDEDRPRERRDGERSPRPGRPERGGRSDRGDRRGPPRDRRSSRERPGRDR